MKVSQRSLAPTPRLREGGDDEKFGGIEFAGVLEFDEDDAMDLIPDAGLDPVAHASPIGGVRGELVGQVVPPDPVAEHGDDAAETFPDRHRRPSSLRAGLVLRNDVLDAFPTGVG